MFVTFDKEDGTPPQEWVFDPEDVLSSEAKAIEKAYGGSWEQWINGLRMMEVKARIILLWHLIRQEHKSMRFEDTPDFRMRQVQVQMSVAELRALYERMAGSIRDEDIRDAFEAAFQRDIRDAMKRENGGVIEGEIEGVDLPKRA